MPGIRVLPFGGGLPILLLIGGVYFASEHEKGRHEKTNLLCPICVLNMIAPGPDSSGGGTSAASSSTPPSSTPPSSTPPSSTPPETA